VALSRSNEDLGNLWCSIINGCYISCRSVPIIDCLV